MRYSTFYDVKKGRRVYTTKKLTALHKGLQDDYNGVTYQHEDDDILYFTKGMPLKKPLYSTTTIDMRN